MSSSSSSSVGSTASSARQGWQRKCLLLLQRRVAAAEAAAWRGIRLSCSIKERTWERRAARSDNHSDLRVISYLTQIPSASAACPSFRAFGGGHLLGGLRAGVGRSYSYSDLVLMPQKSAPVPLDEEKGVKLPSAYMYRTCTEHFVSEVVSKFLFGATLVIFGTDNYCACARPPHRASSARQ